MYTFNKEERLCSKKLLEELFHSGSSFLLYPYRIVWLTQSLAPSVSAQVVINVPKRRFKRAVDRNLIKRRIREIYRLNKSEELYSFLTDNSAQLIFGINYVGKNIAEYSFMEKKLMAAIGQLKVEFIKKNAD